MQLSTHEQRSLPRKLILKSTHLLDELSRSSIVELGGVMSDYRKILLESRRASSKAFLNLSQSLMGTSRSQDTSLGADANSESSPSSVSPIERADTKLTKVSISFNSQRCNSHLAGFQSAKLVKAEFGTLLRCCLNINLTKPELDALFAKMDVNGSELIDGVEFIRYFFALGKSARRKMQMETSHMQAKKAELLRYRELEDEKRIKEWEAAQIGNHSAEDRDSAFRKLQALSLQYRQADDSVDALYLQGFATQLSPFQFKQHMIKSFGAKLSGAEIAALVAAFSCEDALSVDGMAFLRKLRELQKAELKVQEALQAVLRAKKRQVLSMGQRVDFLPKSLGR